MHLLSFVDVGKQVCALILRAEQDSLVLTHMHRHALQTMDSVGRDVT